MSRLLKTGLYCIPIAILGMFIGMASGAIGVCGNGGWGTVPAILGFIAFLVGIACLISAFIRFVYRRLTA
jgi:hypothetical protein